MKRLIENTVLPGLVTAWRLASWPTSRSPVLVNATTLGLVRPPSADAMTVGSPPSMTATTEFVVPRSMPMILPMGGVCSSLGWGFGKSGLGNGFVWVGGRRTGARGDGHEGRPQEAISQAIAAPDLFHDLALGTIGAGNVGDGLVIAGIERCTGRRIDGAHALALEELAELAIDDADALEPRVRSDRLRSSLDGPVEVVREVEDLADEVLGREPEVALALLGGPALEVEELRALALQGVEVFVGLDAGRVGLCIERLDLRQQLCGAEVDLVGALLGA